MDCPKPTFTVYQAGPPTHGKWSAWSAWTVVPLPVFGAAPGGFYLQKWGRFRDRTRTWTWPAVGVRTEYTGHWKCFPPFVNAWGTGMCQRIVGGHLEATGHEASWVCEPHRADSGVKNAVWTETQTEWCIDSRATGHSELDLDQLPDWGTGLSAWIGEPPVEGDYVTVGCDPQYMHALEFAKVQINWKIFGQAPASFAVVVRSSRGEQPGEWQVDIPVATPMRVLTPAEVMTMSREPGSSCLAELVVQNMISREGLAEVVVVGRPEGIEVGFVDLPIARLEASGSMRLGLQAVVMDPAVLPRQDAAEVVVALRDPRNGRTYGASTVLVGLVGEEVSDK